MPHTSLASVVEPPYVATLDILASEAGVRIRQKEVVRFPVTYLSELMRTVEHHRLMGRISIDYDAQGKPGSVTWEWTR